MKEKQQPPIIAPLAKTKQYYSDEERENGGRATTTSKESNKFLLFHSLKIPSHLFSFLVGCVVPPTITSTSPHSLRSWTVLALFLQSSSSLHLSAPIPTHQISSEINVTHKMNLINESNLLFFHYLRAGSLHSEIIEAAHNTLLNLKPHSLQCADRGEQKPRPRRAADLYPCVPLSPLHIKLHGRGSIDRSESCKEKYQVYQSFHSTLGEFLTKTSSGLESLKVPNKLLAWSEPTSVSSCSLLILSSSSSM